MKNSSQLTKIERLKEQIKIAREENGKCKLDECKDIPDLENKIKIINNCYEKFIDIIDLSKQDAEINKCLEKSDIQKELDTIYNCDNQKCAFKARFVKDLKSFLYNNIQYEKSDIDNVYKLRDNMRKLFKKETKCVDKCYNYSNKNQYRKEFEKCDKLFNIDDNKNPKSNYNNCIQKIYNRLEKEDNCRKKKCSKIRETIDKNKKTLDDLKFKKITKLTKKSSSKKSSSKKSSSKKSSSKKSSNKK